MSDSQEWWETEEEEAAPSANLPVKQEAQELDTTDLQRAPSKITAKWVRSQLSKADWDGFHNKRLNPQLIESMARDASKGLSKRAIMARAGYTARTWSNWVKWAEEGQEPYSLWHRCMMISIASVEEELVDSIRMATESDWKAGKWLLEQLNKEEYGQAAQTTTVNVHGDVKAGDSNSINYFTQDEALNVARIMQTIGALPKAEVVDAEVVDE